MRIAILALALVAPPAVAAAQEVQVATAGEPIWTSGSSLSVTEELVLEDAAKGGGFFSTSGTVDVAAGTVLDNVETSSGIKACSRTSVQLILAHTRACLVDSDADGRFDKYSYNENGKLAALKKPAKYIKRSQAVEIRPSLEARIIYLGATSAGLNLSYREFKDNIARPAFTEELMIPLSTSFPQRVRFKTLEMEIYKIDGMGMQYSIVPARK